MRAVDLVSAVGGCRRRRLGPRSIAEGWQRGDATTAPAFTHPRASGWRHVPSRASRAGEQREERAVVLHPRHGHGAERSSPRRNRSGQAAAGTSVRCTHAHGGRCTSMRTRAAAAQICAYVHIHMRVYRERRRDAAASSRHCPELQQHTPQAERGRDWSFSSSDDAMTPCSTCAGQIATHGIRAVVVLISDGTHRDRLRPHRPPLCPRGNAPARRVRRGWLHRGEDLLRTGQCHKQAQFRVIATGSAASPRVHPGGVATSSSTRPT